MNDAGQAVQYFIGLVGGGWNCDNNQESRAALVILIKLKRIFKIILSRFLNYF